MMESVQVITICLLLTGYGLAKKEFQFRNCDGSSIVILDYAEDLESRTGPVTKNLEVDAEFTSLKTITEEHERYHYDIDIDVSIKKHLFWSYISVPKFVVDRIGRTIDRPELEYMGDGRFRAHCLFEHLIGECLPPKGYYYEIINLRYILSKSLQSVSSLLPSVGWYKVKAHGKTKDGQSYFCIEFEIKLAYP